MKKLYTLSILLLSVVSFGQSVVITRVVDGTLSGAGCAGTTGSSSPKITELYVSGTVDFTNHRIQTESNGAADASAISWSSGLDLTPVGIVTDAFVYLVAPAGTDGTTTFNEMYPSIVLPTGLTAGNIPNGNGNDAYRIVLTDGALPTPAVLSVIDQFGNPLDLPVNDYVTLKIYDVLGNLIETLIEEYQVAGFHSKLFIVNSTLPSGMYFYTLQSGNKILTNKMILIK